MASERVLNTTELLEAILLRRPFEDILKAKAVTKRWKETIDTSVSLKRATYNCAIGEVLQATDPSQIDNLRSHDAPILVPLLEGKGFEALPIFKEKQCEFAPPARLLEPWQHLIYSYGKNPSYNLHVFTMKIGGDGELRMPAAYLSMYLSQPPISAVYLSHRDLGDNWAMVIPHNCAGITLDWIEQIIRRFSERPSNTLQDFPRSDRLVIVSCLQACQ